MLILSVIQARFITVQTNISTWLNPSLFHPGTLPAMIPISQWCPPSEIPVSAKDAPALTGR